jgi:type I restriction enzyme S subunit
MKKRINYLPNLRFPEFRDEWEQKTLGDFLSFKNGINAKKSQYGQGKKFINVLDIINNSFITYDKIIGRVNISEKEFQKNEVRYGDILFQRSSETRKEVGQSNVYLDKEETATFGGFVIRGTGITKYDPLFFNYLLQASPARKEITSKSGGSTRFNVSQGTLNEVKIKIPSLPEQEKIGSSISIIDKRIEQLLHKKKLLKNYKKAISQRIFNQEIRFINNEGNIFPNWKKIKLGDYLINKSVRNKDVSIDLVLSVNNKKGFISQKEQFENHVVASKDLSNYKIVTKNDYAYNPSRINVGSIARLKNFDLGIVSPMYIVFEIKESLNNVFFDNLYQTHYFKYLIKVGCSGSVRDSLNFKDLCLFKLEIPSLPEQEKIGSFFFEIDKKIKEVSRELKNTQVYKKGLVQKMFV